MKTYEVKKLYKSIKKSILVPGSKSITNRAFLLASFGLGKSIVSNPLISDDTKHMLNALNKLGVGIQIHKNDYNIWGNGGKIKKGNYELYLGNAGTAVRFLTSYAALHSTGTIKIDGNERMRYRPLGDLIQGIKKLGAHVISNSNCPPVEIQGSNNFPSEISIRGDVSSQFLSGIIQIAPMLPNGLIINIEGELVSKPYVDITIDVMEKFNVYTENQNYKKFIIPHQTYASTLFEVEADATACTYWEALACITQNEIEVNLPYSSKQGDAKFVDILEKIGADVSKNGKSMTVKGNTELKEIGEIDMNDMPDSAMTLAVIAPFLPGTTVIKNVANMRVKETDRISALYTELSRLGVKVKQFDDGLEIKQCKSFNKGVQIETYDDHRMAMCFAVTGSKIGDITIKDPLCCSKTYPNFFDHLDFLAG